MRWSSVSKSTTDLVGIFSPLKAAIKMDISLSIRAMRIGSSGVVEEEELELSGRPNMSAKTELDRVGSSLWNA